ncbi:MAG TPA: hypothetical protein VLB50_08810 [Ignavibacteriaceae bacterium]|nr:hypothetical protein [Ignavibacteriaceae bacterium]
MDHKFKIIELLGKKNLTNQEINELERLAESDEELRDFIASYKKIDRVVKHSSHLTEEEISGYILYKNEIPGEDNSIIKRIPFIETHLRECSRCTDIFKELNSEYSEIDNYFVETPLILERSAEIEQKTVGITPNKYKTPRYAFASVIIIGFIYLSLYIISSVATPAFYRNAAIVNQSEISVNRGRATDNFQNSLKALENNNYDKAISFLQQDIKQHPDDETIFYSYYILGLSYLKTAERDFLGLFPGYSKERAEKGREYLEKSIERNQSGKFININLNSYYYLAKASLMLNDKNSAKKYLSLVINEKGSKMEEAKKLLGELE